MWSESRRLLALVGDQVGTITAFCGLMAYGVVLLLRVRTRADRIRAFVTLGGSMLWLMCVSAGWLHNDLARWSPLAVFLFAVAIDGRTSSRTRRLSTEKLKPLPQTEQLDGKPISGPAFGSGQPEIG